MAKRGNPGGMGARKMMMRGLFAVVLAMAASPAGACALGDGSTEIVEAPVTVSFRPEGGKITSGAFFVLDVAVCDDGGAPGTLNAVDATMPAHGHGMNYEPVVSQTAPGRFKVEGLMFHMVGSWRFTFEAEAAGQTRKLMVDKAIGQ